MTPQRKRPGRPKKSDTDKVTESIHVKLSPTCYDLLCRLALRTNRPHLTTIARQLLERELHRINPA